ncbi:MAG: hypothetical protein WDM89_04620 [Rhizomicrobium sp.]
MEGGVMQARTHRTIDAFDRSVAMLRDYITRARNRSIDKTGEGKIVKQNWDLFFLLCAAQAGASSRDQRHLVPRR